MNQVARTHEDSRVAGADHGDGRMKDLVCGMDVDPAEVAGSHEHGGQTYYFCSTGCLEKFRTQPEKYLNHLRHETNDRASHASNQTAEQQEFTCPMHAEVRQIGPGSCPKCGMALEPADITAAPSKTEYVCPMHPEVVRSEPGSCPICGMALEPRIVTLEEDSNPELKDMTRRFWFSVALTVPVFLTAMSEMIPGQPLQHAISARLLTWFQLVLATPVVLWGVGLSFSVAGPPSSIEASTCLP